MATRLERDLARFRDRVFDDPLGVLDPKDAHHEFVSGNHGRKLDFDKIETGSDFYIDWVAIYARAFLSIYGDKMPEAVVGIANGANRLSISIAQLLGGRVLGLTTEKVDAKTVKLDEPSLEIVRSGAVKFAVTIEDVGTTGGTTATAVEALQHAGVETVESMNGWQRNEKLTRLEDMGVAYEAVIFEPLPMFSPEACASDPNGYCRQGVQLIPHGK